MRKKCEYDRNLLFGEKFSKDSIGSCSSIRKLIEKQAYGVGLIMNPASFKVQSITNLNIGFVFYQRAQS